jgi:transposase
MRRAYQTDLSDAEWSHIEPYIPIPNTASGYILPTMDNEPYSEERLSPQQLKDRYRRAHDPVLRAHLHIVWQLSLGKPLREVAELAGYSTKWVKEIARRYEERGVESLGDRRHTNPGAANRALLSEGQQRELKQALLEPPLEGGMWSSSKVGRWIERRTGRKGVRAQRGWEYLRKLGNTPQVPRPSNAEADPQEQEAFKKGASGEGDKA